MEYEYNHSKETDDNGSNRVVSKMPNVQWQKERLPVDKLSGEKKEPRAFQEGFSWRIYTRI